jgi:hypothetical protein
MSTDDPFGSDGSGTEDREAASFLSGGGSIAAKFPKVGFVFEGTIVDWEMRQQTDMNTGDLLWFVGNKQVKDSDLRENQRRAAKPANQLLLHIQGEATGVTWETNQYIQKPVPDDDGMRTLYVKGSMQKAIVKAMREAGNATLERGAYIQVKRLESTKARNSDFYRYNYAAKWTPAAANAKAASEFLTKEAEDATGAAADAWSDAPSAPSQAPTAAPASDPWA